MAKKIKELFASNLNGIPASVRSVYSMIVVLNAKFVRLLVAHANIKVGEKRRSPTRVPCSASWNTMTFNFYRSLHCARRNESIIYFPTIYNSCKSCLLLTSNSRTLGYYLKKTEDVIVVEQEYYSNSTSVIKCHIEQPQSTIITAKYCYLFIFCYKKTTLFWETFSPCNSAYNDLELVAIISPCFADLDCSNNT